ncbi:MAG: hypothetical protein ACTSVY_02815 [Candidatus Helarchaeota archaeon]
MPLKRIDDILEQMETILKESNDLNAFLDLLAAFNKEMNELLKYYAKLDDNEKRKIKPFTIFYRNFFEVAIYVTQSEKKFLEPDNYLRLSRLIQNRKSLIKNEFTKLANEEFENIKKIKPILEENLKNKLKKMKNETN